MLQPSGGPTPEEPAQSSDFNPFNEREQQQQRRDIPSLTDATQLATFKVDAPVLGTGVLRPLTFFPIVTTIRSTDSSGFKVPDIPVGQHQRTMDTGVKKNKWAPSSPAQVDRRYSELVEFRSLLVYQFRTIIVPPLPPKSKFDNIGTFLTNENILVAQQRSIVRFLRELAMTPELIYFSTYTPNFFQLPRESFEDWMVSVRNVIEEFRRCNAGIESHSTRKGGLLGSDSVATITDNSTKVVRKIVGMLQSWMGGGSSANADNIYQSQIQQQQQQTLDRRRYPYSTNISDPVNMNHARDSINYWSSVIRFLSEYREALLEATRPYLSVMEQSVGAIAASKDIAEALEHYAAVLGASSANNELSRAAHEAASFINETAEALVTQQPCNRREVYERLQFEVSYMDAALDAIEYVLCLWRYCDEASSKQTRDEYAAYAKDVSDKLREFYEQRFLRNFRRRMRGMIQRKVETGIKYAKIAEERMNDSDFAKTIKDPAFSAYDTAS